MFVCSIDTGNPSSYRSWVNLVGISDPVTSRLEHLGSMVSTTCDSCEMLTLLSVITTNNRAVYCAVHGMSRGAKGFCLRRFGWTAGVALA